MTMCGFVPSSTIAATAWDSASISAGPMRTTFLANTGKIRMLSELRLPHRNLSYASNYQPFRPAQYLVDGSESAETDTLHCLGIRVLSCNQVNFLRHFASTRLEGERMMICAAVRPPGGTRCETQPPVTQGTQKRLCGPGQSNFKV
jgi:hypothetical protein